MKQHKKKNHTAKRAIYVLALSGLIALPAPMAHATDMTDIMQISQPDDSIKNCPALSREISLMDEIMIEAEEKKQQTKVTNTSVGVAQTVGAFMVGSLGGVLGIFAAGALIDNANDNKIERVQDIQNAASQRRNLMAALYSVRNCSGPLAQRFAAIEPAAGEEFTESAINLSPETREPIYND